MTSVFKYGERVEISAAVFSSSYKIPTGVVVFTQNNKIIGTSRLDENGIAKILIPSEKLGYGEHNIIAHYAGNKNFAPSASAATIKKIV